MSAHLRPDFPNPPAPHQPTQGGGPAAPSVPLAADGAALLAEAAKYVPRIPVSGADQRDIEATALHVNLLTQLFLSAVWELSKVYERGVMRALENHNENVPVTRTARPASFHYGLEANLEDFMRSMNDLNGDVVGDVERAIDE